MGMVRGLSSRRRSSRHAGHPDRSTESCTIPVTGMTCAACSARVQRTLEQHRRRRVGQREPDDRRRHGRLRSGVTSPERLVDDHPRVPATAPSCRCPSESAEELLDAQDAARAAEVRDLRRQVRRERGGRPRRHGARHDAHRLGADMRPAYAAARRSPCRWSAGRAGISTPARGPPSGTTAPT